MLKIKIFIVSLDIAMRSAKKKAPETGISRAVTRARYEARTRDPDLGKVVLYQLS